MSMLRGFVAIDLPNNIKDFIAQILTELKLYYQNPSIHWIDPQDAHITLQFMEKFRAEDIQDLITISPLQIFNIEIKEFEIFFDRDRTYILALNVQPQATLKKLSKRLAQKMQEKNYPVEKRTYHGHITLGKIQNPISLPAVAITNCSFTAYEIALFQSNPAIHGSQYMRLAMIKLLPLDED